jgi:hypothetical protein
MFRLLCLLLGLSLPVTCFGLEIRRVAACSGVVLRLRGDINAGDYVRFRSNFKTKETIIGLDLSSDGGDLGDGLRIAELVHKKQLKVYVSGECNSGCAFIFFSAPHRFFAEESRIGVHSVGDSREYEDPGSMLLTLKLARISAKLGVPNSIIGKMVTTRPATISYLDQADLSALDASAGNPFDFKSETQAEAERNCTSTREARKGLE